MTSRTLLQEILADGGLTVLFQPIFEIRDGRVSLYALEALSRGPKGSNAERADVLFEYVRRKGKESEVDRACTTNALKASRSVPSFCAISINVHAATLERDEDWPGFLADVCGQHGLPFSRLILEIVEQQKYSDAGRFFGALDRLRSAGVRIALDDIGLGYSNYRMLIDIRPDFFKIDRYFVSGSGQKPNARAAIESIALLAHRLGARVIAEGIESEDDLHTVVCLGVNLAQGYYLAPPTPVSSQDSQQPQTATA
jgi:EAL domain-containing protein (putative c-di-GMP-specific phosphodiesterase class I)